MMVDDVQPETNIEWLWTLDLFELSWKILRYRRRKQTILDVHRVTAIETILHLARSGMPTTFSPNPITAFEKLRIRATAPGLRAK
jgi:hypothetical protein